MGKEKRGTFKTSSVVWLILGAKNILRRYSRVTKVLAPSLNCLVQLAPSQPPLMVLKAETQLQEIEPSNFYSLPLIQAEEDKQSGKFEAFRSHHSV